MAEYKSTTITAPPEPTAGDTIHTIVRAGLSTIPVLGGAATELFTALITPPLTKRREAWMQSVAEGLKLLEARIDGFKIESLPSDDAFVTTVMQVSQVAVRNHQTEKIEALRNAVLNSALEPPSEAFQSVFLTFIEIATTWHLKVLAFYHEPELYLKPLNITQQSGDYSSTFVSDVFPELRRQEAFRLQIERDLLHYGLIFDEGSWYTRRTTETGEQLLKFVASPAALESK